MSVLFPQIHQPIGIDRFLEVFPEVPGEQFFMILALRTLRSLGAVGAASRLRGVFPIAQTIRGAVRQDLTRRTVVTILLRVVAISFYAHLANATEHASQKINLQRRLADSYV